MEILIGKDKEGLRIDSVVSDILKEKSLSRAMIQKYILYGCKVNNKQCKKSYKLRVGDVLILDEKYWEEKKKDMDLSKDIVSQKGDIDIRYEDDDLIVLYKPKGLVVHPGVGSRDNTLANYLRFYLEQKGEYDFLLDRAGIVHRLDKGVSGLMVVAKSKHTQEYLKGEFSRKNVIKIYHAYLEESKKVGQVVDIKKYLKNMNINLQPWKSWEKVEGYIGRDRINRFKMEFRTYEFPGSKYALSYILFSNNEALIKIDTGRMHQIRATLKYLGYHIKGDKLYGKGVGDEIMLESVLLSFVKEDGNRLTFTL